MILTEQNIQEIYKYFLKKGGIKDSQFDIKQLSSIDKEYIYFPIIYDTPEEGLKFDNGRLSYNDIKDNIESDIGESVIGILSSCLIRGIPYKEEGSLDNNSLPSPFDFYVQNPSTECYYKISYGGDSPFSISYSVDKDYQSINYKKLVEITGPFNENPLKDDCFIDPNIFFQGWKNKTSFLQNEEADYITTMSAHGFAARNSNGFFILDQLVSGTLGLYIIPSTNYDGPIGVYIDGKTEKDILTAAGTTTQLKTINGQSILGEGNIQINTTSSNNIIIQ
jgi:hypothetical protein